MEKISSVKSLFHQIDLGGKASAGTKANSTTTENTLGRAEPSKKEWRGGFTIEDREDTSALGASMLSAV
jgi:hypothetical protein